MPDLSSSAEVRAEAAWQYFETQADAETGLVPAHTDSTWSTPAAAAAQLEALPAAHRLGLINQEEMIERRQRIIQSLAEVEPASIRFDIETGDMLSEDPELTQEDGIRALKTVLTALEEADVDEAELHRARSQWGTVYQEEPESAVQAASTLTALALEAR